MDSGIYEKNNDNTFYLSVNGTEYREITFTYTSTFTLDGSNLSFRYVNDAYIYEFSRVLVAHRVST